MIIEFVNILPWFKKKSVIFFYTYFILLILSVRLIINGMEAFIFIPCIPKLLNKNISVSAVLQLSCLIFLQLYSGKDLQEY